MADKKSAEKAAAAADNKQKALEAALQQIEKTYGKGAIMRLGQNVGMTVDHIPTGSLSLDAALGIGGLPRGRIVEIYGPESSGKTTLALHAVAEAQKLGAKPPLSTWSTRWTRYMPRPWGWTWMRCWFPSPTRGNKPWKSRRR